MGSCPSIIDVNQIVRSRRSPDLKSANKEVIITSVEPRTALHNIVAQQHQTAYSVVNISKPKRERKGKGIIPKVHVFILQKDGIEYRVPQLDSVENSSMHVRRRLPSLVVDMD